MNRFKKKIVSIFTTCAMAVSVLAGAGVCSDTVKAATTEGNLTPALVTDYAAMPAPAAATVNLSGSNGSKDATKESLAKILPIQVQNAGVLVLNFSATGLSSGIEATLYSDTACSTKVGSTEYLSASTLTSSESYTISAAGTYYLKVQWQFSSVPENGSSIKVEGIAYSGAEVTLKDTYQAIYTGDSTKTNYHKLEVAADSLVTLHGNAYSNYDGALSSLSVNLCNSGKTTIDTINFYSGNNYFSYYALKKGTYYVSSNSSSRYQLKATVTKMKDQSGSSQKKAKLIKKKKTVKGIVALTDSTSKTDWYKFKVSKRSKITLKYSAKCTGSTWLRLQIVPADKNYTLLGNTLNLSTGSGKATSKTKINKGTYYIKVTKSYASYSGSYSIQYVK